jgi:tetratricopeptide (TPR) repeat protein
MKAVWQRLKAFLTQSVFVILAVVMAAIALLLSYQNERRVKIELREGVQSVDAEYILARANDATQFADSILSFLEGASALLGIMLFVGGWMFRNNIQQQIEKLQDSATEAIKESRKFVQDSRDDLEKRKTDLQAMESALQQRMDRLVQETTQRLEETQTQARNLFRVLSLQLLAEQQVRSYNIDTAVSTLRSALTINPDDHATNYLLGYLYIQRKQIDLALNHLEHALKSEQNFTPGIAALGLALRRKGDSLDNDGHQAERDLFWGQAESRLLEALSQDHRLTDADGESYFGTLGGLYRRQKRYYAALDAYERAYQVTPNSSYPLINLASIHTHEGNLKQARHYFEKVVEQARLALDDDPRNAWRRCDLAQALLVMGQQDEALKELRAVIKQDPERSVLETVRSGLSFLSESPERIAGLDEMIGLLDETLQGAGV